MIHTSLRLIYCVYKRAEMQKFPIENDFYPAALRGVYSEHRNDIRHQCKYLFRQAQKPLQIRMSRAETILLISNFVGISICELTIKSH